ncbi:retrovirus-related pol polyprotein from transposon TNT 1-94 [Tanacetum coccineum]
MNNLLSLKKNLLIAVLLDLTLLLLVLKLLRKVSLARTMLGNFLGLYILNGEKRSRRLKNQKIITSSRRANRQSKKSSDDETLTSGSDDEEYVVAVRNFKRFFRRKGKFVRQPREEKKSFRQRNEKKGKSDRKCYRCGDPNHLIGECPKPPRNKDQKAFVGGCWSDSENEVEDKTNDETCLMAQSSNEVTLDSSHYSDNASSFDDDSMQIKYDNLCEISLKIINKNKILKTKRELLEKEILELNEKIKKLKRNKEIDFGCESCQLLRLENAKLKKTQVKFVKFDKSANSLREMLNVQKSPSCKIGLGFDKGKASTNETKSISFVGSTADLAGDGSTVPGSVDLSTSQKVAEHVFSPPMSSRSDFVIVRKKLIHNSIENSKRLPLKPSLKNGLGYVKTESRSKTSPPRRNNSSQLRHNIPQPRRNSSGPFYQYRYPMNWNNNQNQGFVHMGNDIQCAGSDTRPPMLDKADFVSWQQRIRLYCRGKDNGINILKSIDEGPFQMGTTRGIIDEGTEGPINLGPERPRVYSELSQEEKDRYNADIRATNIILQGLPKDIYSLINHYTDAKDIWDNVKMLLEGSELTKEDRESQLYDDFEHFRQNKGETIHSYYVRFAKLINDMRRTTRMTIQHEAHANENKMMLERLTQQTVDPLALMSNVSHQQYHSQSSTNPPNTYHQPHSADTSQSDLGISPTENLIENLTNTLALLTQSYKTFLPQTNNQLRTSSNPRNQATVQDGRLIVQNVQGRQNRGQGNSARGAGAVGYGRAQNRVGNANPGQARQVKCYNCNGLGHIARNCTQPKRPQNSEYFKDKMLLMQAQENGVILDEEQSLFLAGGLDNAIDEDEIPQPVQDLALECR